MIIAWMLFTPIGIILARYFKSLFPNFKTCDVQFWFFIHRPLMLSVPLISLAAFILILSQLNWSWVTISSSVGFTHSIFGIVVVALSLVQVRNIFIKWFSLSSF